MPEIEPIDFKKIFEKQVKRTVSDAEFTPKTGIIIGFSKPKIIAGNLEKK